MRQGSGAMFSSTSSNTGSLGRSLISGRMLDSVSCSPPDEIMVSTSEIQEAQTFSLQNILSQSCNVYCILGGSI